MTDASDSRTTARPTALPIWLLLAALGLLVSGLMLGLSSHGNCGTAWSPASETLSDKMVSSATGMPDNFDAACQQQLGSDGTLGAVLVALAGASALTAVLAWQRGRAVRSQGSKPVMVVELTPDGPRSVEVPPTE